MATLDDDHLPAGACQIGRGRQTVVPGADDYRVTGLHHRSMLRVINHQCEWGPTPTRCRSGARRLTTATPTRLPRWGPGEAPGCNSSAGMIEVNAGRHTVPRTHAAGV